RDEALKPRVVIGLSGGGNNVRALLRRQIPGGSTVRHRLKKAGFSIGATGMWLLQNAPGYEAVEEFDNRSCAAARCVAGAKRASDAEILALAENWWGSHENPHPIHEANEPAMAHCDTCAANLEKML